MFRIASFISLFIIVLSITSPVQAGEGGVDIRRFNKEQVEKLEYTNLYKKGEGVQLQLQNITQDESDALSILLQRDGWTSGEEKPIKIFCSLRGKPEISSIKLSCFFQHKGKNIEVYNEGSFDSNQIALASIPIHIKEMVSTILSIHSLLYRKVQ